MLQQTTVAAVIPYFERFLARFPTLPDLARAPEEAVLAVWSGLGYYSRGRNLWRGARHVLENFGGALPPSAEELLRIPGIGPYTAGAIASIAFGEKAAIVDGNVKRVFARYYGIEDSIDDKATTGRLWSLAQKWVDASQTPADLNQGIMEVGATICRKSSPDCDHCPLRRGCVALETHRVDAIPVRKAKTEKRKLNWLSLVYTNADSIYLENSPDKKWWRGLWDTPHIPLASAKDLEGTLKRTVGKCTASIAPLGRAQHTVTTNKITVHAYRINLPRKVSFSPHGRWFKTSELGSLPMSSLVSKVLALLV